MGPRPQVLAAGKPTAVVLTNGGVLAVPELKKSAGAIVEAWFPGVYGGRAVADVIFGAYNPGGKLPVTMYDGDYVNQVMPKRRAVAAPCRPLTLTHVDGRVVHGGTDHDGQHEHDCVSYVTWAHLPLLHRHAAVSHRAVSGRC